MLARDWYYNDRRQVGVDFAADDQAASYDQKQRDSTERARATLMRLGVKPGWRVADIGCGAGILACEAAEMGADVEAIDISPAMLKLTEVHAADKGVAVKTQATGFLSFAYKPNTFDLIVSEYALHQLPDFWKAVAMARVFNALKPGGKFFLRDVVFGCAPDGVERSVDEWTDFILKNHAFSREEVATHIRDEHSTFGWVVEGLLKEARFQLISADYHAPVYGTYLAQRPLTNGGSK
jgi:2-polyprenyl-3-methyl-5-hydroxy-6-metoxy-1,4-benzoquinol methylase